MDYHEPVLLKECIEALNIKPDGVYVDVTFGGGGHSKLILKQLNANGHLYGFDQDGDALNNGIDQKNFTFVQGNFKYLKRYMKYYGVEKIDGLLADLGVSSHQFDVPERGFSFRYEADLDMRMNSEMELTAQDVLANYEEGQLIEMFSKYGQVRNTKTLVRRILEERSHGSIKTVGDLNGILESLWMGNRNRYFAQVYQALRIEVNNEMGVLEDMFESAIELLKPGARLVVISYHSLEDKLTKSFMKFGNANAEPIKDDFGKIHRPFVLVNKNVIEATSEEIKRNNRARSAKLRIAERR